MAHVFEEVLEHKPPITDPNSPAAVVFVVLVVWIEASILDAGPRFPCPRFRLTVTQCKFLLLEPLNLGAAARSSVSASEVRDLRFNLSSAVTSKAIAE